jgi:hypothetical protein
VFGADGRVVLSLTLWGPPGTVPRAEIDELAQRLIGTAAAATTAVGGVFPRALFPTVPTGDAPEATAEAAAAEAAE